MEAFKGVRITLQTGRLTERLCCLAQRCRQHGESERPTVCSPTCLSRTLPPGCPNENREQAEGAVHRMQIGCQHQHKYVYLANEQLA